MLSDCISTLRMSPAELRPHTGSTPKGTPLNLITACTIGAFVILLLAALHVITL